MAATPTPTLIRTTTPFTIPGTTQASIADVLLANNVSWKSYNDQWNQYLTDKYQLNYGKVGAQQRPVLQHLQPVSIPKADYDQ